MSTNPNTLALGFLAIPILLIGTIIYQLSKLVLAVFSLYSSSSRKQHIISLVVAVLITGAFVFQSVGRLTIGDLAILLVFSGLSVFYLVKLL